MVYYQTINPHQRERPFSLCSAIGQVDAEETIYPPSDLHLHQQCFSVCLFTYFNVVLSFWYLPLTTSIGLGPFVLWRRSSRNIKTSPQEIWGLLKFLRPCGDSAQRHVIWLHGGVFAQPSRYHRTESSFPNS